MLLIVRNEEEEDDDDVVVAGTRTGLRGKENLPTN